MRNANNRSLGSQFSSLEEYTVIQDYLMLAILLLMPSVIYAFLRLTKVRSENVEASPIHLIFRTRILNRFLAEIPKSHWRPTAILSHILLAVYPGLVLLFFILFGSNLLNLIGKPSEAGQVSIAIPGITLGLRELPYVMIALFTGVVVHEFAHGVIGSSRGIPIKWVGVGLFLSFGFALVEFDDDVFKKVDRRSRIQAVAAGPSANVIVSAIIVLLASMLLGNPGGIIVLNTSPPASSYLSTWDIIVKINATNIVSDQAFRSYMASVKPGELLVVQTLERVVHVVAGVNPTNSSRGFLGVSAVNYFPRLDFMGLRASHDFILLMSWINLINMSLAIVNVAPVAPLDGGKMIDELLSDKSGFLVRVLKLTIFAMSAVILAGNLLLSVYRFGL